MSISTHVLDTSLGRPAKGVPAFLEMHLGGGEWKEVKFAETNDDGRIPNLMAEDMVLEGVSEEKPVTFRLTFDTGGYFKSIGVEGFYPYVPIIFQVKSLKDHYHVPLLISPYGYSTYRGS